ncbi:helix-turn-helix domain-containing protein [Mucilaginibacter sp. Bleaf8]|uniref:AraC family transcriptional regulator n=1 Tax=Mucilaginibacter sp. Bleaf8 TaxID=2834430 RepID=UPI001BD0364F|nr:AraC family transcriptional regulator [Mucilaginibacter sp. Bleaf8]MBS7566772.1 helix-turn-helix domain-containing protein [Mucilaginibacter sp. Bleaf8]
MKVLQFTLPVPHDKSVIAEQVTLPYFYPYLHRHQEAQITWIQEGDGTLITGNNMHTFTSGEIYLIGANTPHLFKSNPEYFEQGGTKNVKACSIYFDPEGVLKPLFDLPEMKICKSFLTQHQQGFKVPAVHFNDITSGLLSIKNTTGSDQLLSFLQLIKVLQNMNQKLEPLCERGNASSITESEGIRISNIFNYIIQHHSESIALEDVANTAYMTPQAFCRYFKKHTGHTFISFLNEVRVNEACKKLTAHKFVCISTVAYSCGFNSITNFNRVFKSIVGTSPRDYMDNYMSNVSSLTKFAS